ncbi:MAG: effector binding domain-containing protein [Candidatus Aegiribacteria sp.]|nr:effector binding domain-containing protein [Candidatus Aegiribacteria sp.]
MLRITATVLILFSITNVFAEEVDQSFVIEVEIVTIEGFTVIGSEIHSSDSTEIMTLWEEFVPRIQEIPGVEMDDDAYGVFWGNSEICDEFSYLACVESDMTGPLPGGMIELNIPGGEYAVFTFPFEEVEEAYAYIYGEWLLVSAYEHGAGYDFEYYPAEFIPSDEGVLMQLYVSVE